MPATLEKFDLLEDFEKREVSDFIDFLLSRKKNKNLTLPISDFPESLQSVSVWNEEDLQVFEQSRYDFNKIQSLEW